MKPTTPLRLLVLIALLTGALAIVVPMLRPWNDALAAASSEPVPTAVGAPASLPVVVPSAQADPVPADPSATTRPTAAPSATPQGGSVDCTVRKCIALTFDDGPGPYTEQLLTELQAANVHATFFLLGQQVSAYPGVARQIAANGHQIGSHTYDHPQMTKLSAAAQQAEVDRTDAAFEAAGLARPTLLRPPYGAQDSRTRALGMALILWDVDTLDWQNRSTVKTTANALAGAHPGAIVLMHDIHPSTVAAVPGIIAELRAQGYVFVTIEQMCGTLAPGQVVTSCGHHAG